MYTNLKNMAIAIAVLFSMLSICMATPSGSLELTSGSNISTIDNDGYRRALAPDIAVTVGPDTDYNAKFYDYLTDKSNDYIEINKAIVQATKGNGEVQLSGSGFNVGEGSILLKEGVGLYGIASEFDQGGYPGKVCPKNGTLFNVTSTTYPAIKVEGSNTIYGIQAYYPNQNRNAAPAAYPAFITQAKNGTRFSIEKVYGVNPYIFMDFQTYTLQVNIKDVAGYPLYKGIVLENDWGGSTLDNVQFWPGFGSPGSTLTSWVWNHATGIEITRHGDGVSFSNTQIFGYEYGIHATGAMGIQYEKGRLEACKLPVYMLDCTYCQVTTTPLVSYEWPSGTGGLALAWVEGGHDNEISHSIGGGPGYGVILLDSSKNRVQDNTLGFGTRNDGDARGIWLNENSINNLIDGNIVPSAGGSNTVGIFVQGSSNTFSGNHVTHCQNGIQFYPSAENWNFVDGNHFTWVTYGHIGTPGANDVIGTNMQY